MNKLVMNTKDDEVNLKKCLHVQEGNLHNMKFEIKNNNLDLFRKKWAI